MRWLPLFFTLSIQFVFAQQPFAPTGARWYEDPSAYGGSFLGPVDIYESRGDEVVNGLSMRAVGPYFFYQEGHKVYFWDSSVSKLKLIYDFDVTVGDSVTFDFLYSEGAGITDGAKTGIIVEDTQTVVSGISLKRLTWHYVAPGQDFFYQYMERVGVVKATSAGSWHPVIAVDPNVAYVTVEEDPFPRCYEDADITYKSPQFLSYGDWPCDYTGATNVEEVEKRVSIYPNPTSDWINITSPQPIQYVEIFDLQGKLVQHVSGNVERVRMKEKGCFILKIHTKDQAWVEKLLVR